ncbi:MAG: hypothetical protein ACREA7_05855 [Nitrosotalea sp.]
MKGLLFLAVLVSGVLLVHTASAEMWGATKQGENNLESYTIPVFLGIFTYQSSNPVVIQQPSVSTPSVTPTSSNATQDWLAQFSPFTPQNAYTTFASQLNQTVQAIFWGQFNYTEQQTNAGLAAMNQILQNGGSSDQARNAFIQNASTSRSNITTVNNNLNVQYGNANSTVQSEFDQYGDLR